MMIAGVPAAILIQEATLRSPWRWKSYPEGGRAERQKTGPLMKLGAVLSSLNSQLQTSFLYQKTSILYKLLTGGIFCQVQPNLIPINNSNVVKICVISITDIKVRVLALELALASI